MRNVGRPPVARYILKNAKPPVCVKALPVCAVSCVHVAVCCVPVCAVCCVLCAVCLCTVQYKVQYSTVWVD